MSFTCTDKDTLIAYVYGECDSETRDEVDAHLATCHTCAEEVGGFNRVRASLSRWAPPERIGSFRLVRDDQEPAAAPARVLRPARWWQAPLPALGRVAAAVLLFAGGAALANLEVRYDHDGFAVRTGWQKAPSSDVAQTAPPPVTRVTQTAAPAPAGTEVAAPNEAATPWRPDLALLEQRLRSEFQQELTMTRMSGASGRPASIPAGSDAAERRILANVQAMIDDSAQRQQLWTSFRINQVVGDLQAQHKADLARQQQLDAISGPGIPTRQRPMNNLFPVTWKK